MASLTSMKNIGKNIAKKEEHIKTIKTTTANLLIFKGRKFHNNFNEDTFSFSELYFLSNIFT